MTAINYEVKKHPRSPKLSVEVGTLCVTADTLTDLKLKLREELDKRCSAPKVAVVKVGDLIVVVLEHAGIYSTLTNDRVTEGVLPMRETGFGRLLSGDVNEIAQGMLRHLTSMNDS